MVLKFQNQYLKTIAEKVSGKMIKKHKNNNQLLKEIAENIGEGGSSTTVYDTITVEITYTDGSKETVELLKGE